MGEGIKLTLDTYTEATVTVLNVSSSVLEEAFEGNSVVLLDDDYLKVLDVPSTQGIVPGYVQNTAKKLRSIRMYLSLFLVCNDNCHCHCQPNKTVRLDI